ncbi:hypothetical protein JI664_04645 [Rhodobacter sp. NTK016B]|uniref:hypothetical protein n=1 Tax=Rhodobacter sp. NTK016B TaxID=2759676 RepID=UPI001A8C904E|nr:hypothetical protein [Rhodobacter sp. NTK016B]MBN8291246.1 hypothetical protein [Rhodobacter sp. NTK016B]
MARHRLRNPMRGEARRALHKRLRAQDPHSPPPPSLTPKEARREAWLMAALFCTVIVLGALAVGFGIL